MSKPPRKKDAPLTAADVDNIVTENFAPDIKKLAHEIGANFYDPDVVQATCVRIAASHGQRTLWKAIALAEIIYGGDEPLWRLLGSSVSGKRKKTTKAEAVARHITALVELLENEPDSIVRPILGDLIERVDRVRTRRRR
jgi:hypothetical protein